LDDFRHTAKVFAQANSTTKPEIGLLEKTVIHAQGFFMGEIGNVFLSQQLHVLAVNANELWADLLIIPDLSP
jgi:hypothetical protein